MAKKNSFWAIKATVNHFFPFFLLLLGNIYVRKLFREKKNGKFTNDFLIPF